MKFAVTGLAMFEAFLECGLELVLLLFKPPPLDLQLSRCAETCVSLDILSDAQDLCSPSPSFGIQLPASSDSRVLHPLPVVAIGSDIIDE